MAHITFQDVLNTLEASKQKLLAAGGEDKQVSRDDLKRLLEEESSEQERAFLRLFYRFLRILEGDRPRMRVTEEVLENGTQYIQQQLLPLFEISDTFTSLTNQKLVRLKPAAYPLAMELLRTTRENTKMTTKEVAELISENTSNLFFDDFGSESSEPIEAFYLEANLEAITPETFRETLDLSLTDPKDTIARFESADKALLIFIEQHFRFGLAEQARSIVDTMKANLDQLSVIILGEDYNADVPAEHPVFVIGLGMDGDLAGFKSQVIWT